MAASSVLAFWAVALLLIAVPGADWAFTIDAGVRGRVVVPAVSGLVVGYGVMTLVVAAGVGALVAGSPAALTALTAVGGAYLMWHGLGTFRAPSTPAATIEGHLATGGWTALGRGIGVSGLNPKGMLVFLALLPQFTDPASGWPVAGQIALLGLVFMATCAAFYLALGCVARGVLQARPNAARLTSRVAGIGMFLVGAGLVLDRLVH